MGSITAVTARQQGDDYQAYHFCIQAADMLRPTAEIAEVGYEVGDYKSFDDVAAKYSQPRIHAHGIAVDADYFQIKFSVNYGKAITAEALVDPAFSGAESVSFLERLRDAVRIVPPGASHRFVLITPRPLDPNAALSELLNTIQEFEHLFPEVNRRSLQRDLKKMVDIGLLVTEGETHLLLYRLAEPG